MEVTKGRGGNEELVCNGYRVTVWDNERKFWKWIVMIVAQYPECT